MLVLASLYFAIEARRGSQGDPRAPGSAEDIVGLAARADLNVLFVLVDTLRASRLGSYGYERDTSPEIDRLASTGVRFAHHLAQSSWTKCSMASLWTSLYPSRTGVTRFDDVLPASAELPAEILKRAGFRTVGIYRNGWVAPTFGFDQGFDVYTRPAPRPPPPSVRRENPTLVSRGTDEDAVASAVEFLRASGDERWFLYLHLMDVHEYLYDEETALFGGSYSDVYDNSIRWTDRVLGVLLDQLAAEGQRAKTLIAIAADHGEAFRERGVEGHARRVYPETTEVPLVLSFPFRLEPGVVVEARTRNVDIWPTLLELVGLEPPGGIDGRSLVPDILASERGEAPSDAGRTGVAYLDQHWGQRGRDPLPSIAVVEGPLRYVRATERGRVVEQLFDRARDAAELEDRAGADPAAFERLRGLADAHLEAAPVWGEAPTREMDELELNQLRALGYAIP